MNITKQYVDVLRYVSAHGKRSILEIPRPIIKKGTTLKYTGLVEYKSIPIGMPNRIASITYKQFELLMSKCNETKSSILNAWFELITPKQRNLTRIQVEVESCFEKENIEKIEFFKTLSEKEKKSLLKYKPDLQFIATLSGHKPAWFCEHGFNKEIDFSKIKQNPKIADNFDIVTLPNNLGLYFTNKKEVLKVIDNNKDVYSAFLGLAPNEKNELIYEKLLEALQAGKISICKEGEALFGITLGFPRHSAMIFEMERILRTEGKSLRDNIPLFREKLLELLHSEKCPFRDFPPDTLNKLENHIKNMKTIDSGTNVCQCITFGDEKNAINELYKLQEDFDKNFKVEHLF